MREGKPAKNRISSSFLFLMELILAITLFSVAAAASVSVFVRAHNMSAEATLLGTASGEAASVVELIRSCGTAEEVREKITALYPEAEMEAVTVRMLIRIPSHGGEHLLYADVVDFESVLEGTVSYYESSEAEGDPVVSIPFAHYLAAAANP